MGKRLKCERKLAHLFWNAASTNGSTKDIKVMTRGTNTMKSRIMVMMVASGCAIGDGERVISRVLIHRLLGNDYPFRPRHMEEKERDVVKKKE